MKLLFLLFGAALAQTHDDFGADRNVDSFGKSTLTPPCAKIECGAMSCDAPFQLKTDDTCCGYCWAPDHIVPLDRHQPFDSPHKTDGCPGAPKFCNGPGPAATCFTQPCKASEDLHCGPTDCCGRCQKRR